MLAEQKSGLHGSTSKYPNSAGHSKGHGTRGGRLVDPSITVVDSSGAAFVVVDVVGPAVVLAEASVVVIAVVGPAVVLAEASLVEVVVGGSAVVLAEASVVSKFASVVIFPTNSVVISPASMVVLAGRPMARANTEKNVREYQLVQKI